jgi:hypothetical protein
MLKIKPLAGEEIRREGGNMKKSIVALLMAFGIWVPGVDEIPAQDQTPAQERIMMERGEKVKGQRLKLVKRVIERYKDCQVLSEEQELTGLVINGVTYSDFTIIIRDAKRTIVVVTSDGVVSFDY